MRTEAKLDALGLSLFDLDQQYRANPAGARFSSHLAINNVLYLSIEQGYEAARYAALSSLAAIKYALGDLDRVHQAVQLIGFVNSAPGFGQQPRVINGATDLLAERYGDRGKPTRAAIGCQGLDISHSVEIVLTILFTGDGIKPPLARDHYAR